MAAEHTVVIGSGMAGLGAAAILAQLGRRVTVLEAAPVSAPLLRGFSRRGLRCDVGLHYSGGLAPGGLLHRLFAALAIDQVEAVPLDPTGFDRIVWPARAIDLRVPVGLEAVRAALTEAFGDSRPAIEAYLDSVSTVRDETPFLNPELPPERWPASPFDRVSLAGFLRSEGASDGLVDLLGRYGELLCGMHGEEIPLRTHAVVMGSYFASAHTIRGGGAVLADALVAALSARGGRVEVGRPVKGMELGDGGVAAVVLADGERIAADQVIFTPHPAVLPGLLDGSPVAESYRRRLARSEDTPPMLLAFLRHQASPSCNTYLFFDPPAEVANGCRHVGVMAGSPAAAVDQHAALCLIRDAGELAVAAAGGSRGLTPRPGRRQIKQRLATEAMEMVDRHLGLPLAAAEVLEIVPPASFAAWTASRGGAAYGMKRPVGGRRLHAVTPVPGLYLAGQSILCPGIMGALASALVAAGLIVGHERVWHELMSC